MLVQENINFNHHHGNNPLHIYILYGMVCQIIMMQEILIIATIHCTLLEATLISSPTFQPISTDVKPDNNFFS